MLFRSLIDQQRDRIDDEECDQEKEPKAENAGTVQTAQGRHGDGHRRTPSRLALPACDGGNSVESSMMPSLTSRSLATGAVNARRHAHDDVHRFAFHAVRIIVCVRYAGGVGLPPAAEI